MGSVDQQRSPVAGATFVIDQCPSTALIVVTALATGSSADAAIGSGSDAGLLPVFGAG